MVSMTLPAPVSGREALGRAGPRLRARPLLHPPESMDGIPYYDDELAMAQSAAHRHTIFFVGTLLDQVAKATGLQGVSDYPIWYRRPEGSEQRPLYPDYALAANPSIKALTANDLLLVLEVVTTSKAAKERKDTVQMRDENAAHGVPEFVLLYPESEDARAVVWHRLDEATGRYRDVAPSAAGRYRSTAIPGLEIEVLPRADWTEGRKVRVWFQGAEVRGLAAEAQARAAAEQRVEQERTEKEWERAEKERLLALLKQAGIDPGA